MKTLISFLLLTISSIITAQVPGTLDSSFNQSGKLVLHFNESSNGNEGSSDIHVFADNSMLIASNVQFHNSQDVDMGLTKLDEFGNRDTAFGNNGQVTIAFDLGGALIDKVNDIVVYEDGRILLVGYVQGMNGNNDFALARLNSNGSLDDTFDNDGKLIIDFDEGGVTGDIALSVVLSPSNTFNAPNIIIVGDIDYLAGGSSIGLVKYDDSGSPLILTNSIFNPNISPNTTVGVIKIVKASAPINSYWILGYLIESNGTGESPYLIKIDSNGNVLMSNNSFVYDFVVPDSRLDNGYYGVAKKPDSDEFIFIGYDDHNGVGLRDCSLLGVDVHSDDFDPIWAEDNLNIHTNSTSTDMFGVCYDGVFNESDQLIIAGDVKPNSSADRDMALFKLNDINVADLFGNGALVYSSIDTTFGNQGGIDVAFDVGGASSDNFDSAYFLTLSPDGSILALGDVQYQGTKDRTAVIKVFGGGKDVIFKSDFE